MTQADAKACSDDGLQKANQRQVRGFQGPGEEKEVHDKETPGTSREKELEV